MNSPAEIILKKNRDQWTKGNRLFLSFSAGALGFVLVLALVALANALNGGRTPMESLFGFCLAIVLAIALPWVVWRRTDARE